MTGTGAPGSGTYTAVSYCRICEPLCGLLVDVADGRAVAVRGDPDHPSSQGYLCPKGATIHEVTNDPERVLMPLRGDGDGNFEPVSWDEALEEIACRTQATIDAHGPDAVAYYSGNPAGFGMAGHMWAKRFIDLIGSTGSYSAAPQDTSSRWAASHFLYGNTHATVIPDIEHTDFFLCVGANPFVTHGSLLSVGRIKQKMRDVVDRGGRVVVVDPARTKTAAAFEHVSLRPSSDSWMLAAMLHIVFEEGLTDPDLEEIATGTDDLQRAVSSITPDIAATWTGVPAERITELAIAFATAPAACAYSRLGLCRGWFPTLANYLLDALNVVTGNFDRRGGVVFGAGLVDFPAMLAKVGRKSYSGTSSRVGALPEVGGRLPWVLPQEITTPGPGQVRALYTIAGNPVSSTPDGGALERALHQLDLFVSLDLYVTETNRCADFILPAPTFLERPDIVLPFGGGMPRPWVQYTEPVVDRIGDTREEWQVYHELLVRMGIDPGPGPWEAIEKLIDESDRARTDGWTMERIKAHPHGVELGGDVPTGVGSERIRAYTAGARDKVDLGAAPVLQQMSALESMQISEDELLLIGRRDLRSINSWMHNVRAPRGSTRPTLHIHPEDARSRELRTDDTAEISTNLGSLKVVVEVTGDVHPGTVSYPHGWGHRGGWSTAIAHGGVNINLIVPNQVETKDPLSGMSLLDGVPVRVVACHDA